MKHTETLVFSTELTKTFNERKFIWGYIPKYISLDVPHVTMVTLVRHLTIFSLGQRKIYWRIKTLMFASICVLFPSCKRKCSAQCFVIIFSSYITVLRSVTFTLRFSWLKFALKNWFFSVSEVRGRKTRSESTSKFFFLFLNQELCFLFFLKTYNHIPTNDCKFFYIDISKNEEI